MQFFFWFFLFSLIGRRCSFPFQYHILNKKAMNDYCLEHAFLGIVWVRNLFKSGLQNLGFRTCYELATPFRIKADQKSLLLINLCSRDLLLS